MPELNPIIQRISTKYDPAGITSFVKDLGSLKVSSALAVTAGLAVVSFMVQCGREADKAQAIQRQLNLTLETTGRISQISAPQLAQFATQLQSMSTFDDESIKQAYIAISEFERVP